MPTCCTTGSGAFEKTDLPIQTSKHIVKAVARMPIACPLWLPNENAAPGLAVKVSCRKPGTNGRDSPADRCARAHFLLNQSVARQSPKTARINVNRFDGTASLICRRSCRHHH